MITALSNRSSSARPLHWQKRLGTFLKYVLLLGGAFIMIYPLIWLIRSSFKPENMIFSDTGLLSPGWYQGNYSDGWNALDYPFGAFIINSLIICLGSIAGNLISCSMAAYAFARLRFKYKALWFILVQGAIMLPTHILIVPQYILFKEFNWIGTFLPLVVPKFFATDAFFIFLMIQFIRGIPTELDDAAKMDGCSRLGFYVRVILPLSLPALVTTAIFTFIWTWNDFFSQLIYLSDEEQYTVPRALGTFLDSTGNSAYGQLFAMSVVSLLPIFLFFLFFQRLLIEGASTSGIKG